MDEGGNVFSLLAKPVRRLVQERGFPSPTDPQIEAIPLILDGKNVLLIAPTGTGKTEAAVLPIFSRFIEQPKKIPGIKILYITPLRALNRDLLNRFEWWCEKLDIKLAVRHGDTEIKERTQQSRSPPDLLITTPETLQAILPGRNMRRHLKAVRWVIVDEIHEFSEDKRGSLLALALERLRMINENTFQIVGLSATIGTPERVAQFLAGTNRSISVVKVPVARYMRFSTVYPSPSSEDYVLATQLYTHPEVAARLRIMRKLIEDHQAVLLFTNTRAISEVLASRFKVWDSDFPVSIHHGSLSKPARVMAERGLKDGGLKGLVCTSSLELGIDVGSIDLCIQYMSPRQTTRLVQRVGRSGHRIGRIAEGVIITMDSDDTLETLVIARRAYKEDLEPVTIPEKPLDALAIQIIGLFTQRSRWNFQEILDLFKEAYSYRNLDEVDLIGVLRYMHTRHPRLAWVSFEDKMVIKPQDTKAMYQYYFENLSMIPDVKSYLVMDETTNTPVGVLDEDFVAEYGDPGTKFIVRGSAWKIVNIYGDKIFVEPIDDPTGAIPSWVGEQIPVPFEVAREVGKIRSFVEEKLKSIALEDITNVLAKRYTADKETISRAMTETLQQIHKGLQIPTHKRVTIEEVADNIIIHSSFGSLVNRTIATLLGHVLSESTGYTIGIQQDPYRIIIQTQGLLDSITIKDALLEMSKKKIKESMIEAFSKTGLFKRRMIQVARRFGAISKWADFSNISLDQLKKSFEETVIFEEAIKETIEKDADLRHSIKILNMIRDEEIEVVVLDNLGEATPIAQIGIEKIGGRTNLIPPEKMGRIAIEAAKARLFDEVRTFVCTRCWKFVQMMKLKDLPEKMHCPNCGAGDIGILNETEKIVSKICARSKGQLTAKEKKIVQEALETAKLLSSHGKMAALVLVGKRLRPSDVENILSEEDLFGDRLFELIVDAERRTLSERFD